MRALALNLAPADWDKGSQYISSLTGFGGTTSDTQFLHADDTSMPMEVKYDYARHPYGDWDNYRIIPLLPAMEFTALDSDTTAPEEDIDLGAPRTLTAVSRIQLPAGFHSDPPDAVHVKTDFATFDKTYKVDGQQLVVERTITVLKKKVPKEKWKDYQAFTKDIGMTSGEPWITLMPPTDGSTLPVAAPKLTTPAGPSEKRPSIAGTPAGSGGSGSSNSETKTVVVKVAPPTGAAAASSADTSTDSASELMNLVRDRLRARDLAGAKTALVRVTRPAGVSGWGTFRVVVTATGIAEAQQMSGESKVAGMKDALMGMKFPELLPPGSKARLLRSAVVSCSSSPCEVVLVPDGGLQTERE